MAMRRIAILVVVAMVGALGTLAATDGGQFRRLDSLIAKQPHIIAEKEARLAQMKAGLAHESNPRGRFGALKRLYEEYSAYQYDSAYAYVNQCISLAQSM